MAWETRRNGRRYYYAKRRILGKVVSVYIGSGAPAEEVAMRLLTKLANRREDLAKRSESKALEDALVSLEKSIRELVEERLIIDGYHQHRGQWRKRRNAN